MTRTQFFNRLYILFFLFVNSSAFAYQPPTGIPDPTWGTIHPIDTQAPPKPTSWPSEESTGFYYVDNTHLQATDSGNPFGYPDKPRVTIPEGDLQAGEYVEIHGGPYRGGGQIIIRALGTEANPVWVRGGDNINPAHITGEMIVKGSYVFLENFNFTENNRSLRLRTHNGTSLNHAVIRSSEFSGPGTASGNDSAVSIYGTPTQRVSDIVIYNNHIHDFGDDSPTSNENDYHGIIPGYDADRIWILNNHIHNMGGDSVQVGMASIIDESRVDSIYVGYNKFHADRENAIDIKEADNIIISSNELYDYELVQNGTSSDGTIVVIHNQPTNVWIINNKIYNGVYGIVTTGSTNTWLIGNEIHNIRRIPDTDSMTWGNNWNNPDSLYSQGAAIHFRGTSTGGVLNNSIYGSDTGIQLAQGNDGYTILNNIIYGRTDQFGHDIISNNSQLQNNSVINNNLFSNESSIYWGGIKYTLNGFTNGTSQCNDCIIGNPAFKDTPNGNFSLRENSAAINIGTSIINTHSFSTYYPGYNIDSTLRGSDRIISNNIDIGANEYAPPQVMPPTNVIVQ